MKIGFVEHLHEDEGHYRTGYFDVRDNKKMGGGED